MCFIGFGLALFSFFRHRRQAIKRELEAHLDAGERVQQMTYYRQRSTAAATVSDTHGDTTAPNGIDLNVRKRESKVLNSIVN